MQANIVRQKSPFFPANTLIYKRKFRAVAIVPIHYGVVCRNPANRLFTPQNRITLLPPPQTSRCVLFSGSSIVLSSERLAFYPLLGTTRHACRWNKVLHKGSGRARDKMPLPKYRVRVNFVASPPEFRIQKSGFRIDSQRLAHRHCGKFWCY